MGALHPGLEELETRIERRFTLAVAAELIPMSSLNALYQFLFHNKELFPARYQTVGGPRAVRGGYKKRMLTESEILKIREMITHYEHPAQRGIRSGSGPISSIIARALNG